MARKQTRKNRYKKNVRKQRQHFLRRMAAVFKLAGLVAVLLAISALFMMGYAAVTRSDYFRTQNIEVTGNQRLTRTQVLRQAQLQPGDNLLAVNLSLMRKRLLAHPWIAAAQLMREIPDSIHIHIQEHEAIAVVNLGRKFLINTQGRIFKEYSDQDALQLPLMTGIDYADISLGDDALSPTVTAALKVLHLSREKTSALPYSAIGQLHMDKEMGITLTAWQNKQIKLGNDGFEVKFKRIKQLLPTLKHKRQWRGFQTIDLYNSDRVVVQMGI